MMYDDGTRTVLYSSASASFNVVLYDTVPGYHTETLLKNKKVDIPKTLAELKYITTLRKKQEELIKLQN